MVIINIEFFYWMSLVILLTSCSGDIYDPPRSRVFGIWKLDSITDSKKSITIPFNEFSYEITQYGKLTIKKNDSVITVKADVFNTAYSNYVMISGIKDSAWMILNKKWFITQVTPSNFVLDSSTNLNIARQSIYFHN